MSEYAAFADAATSVDATDRNRTFISYYSYGAAIALALDLSLREMSNGKQSLDDYMRLLWQRFGKPGGPAPGLVGKPYSLRDIRDALADLTSNRAFANDFFDKYIEGRELPDYATLLRGIGYVLRPARADAAWIGNAQVTEVPDGLRVGVIAANRDETRVPVAFDTPLYKAGVDEDDVITKIDDQAPTLAAWRAIAQRKPGDIVTLVVRRRDGKLMTTTAKLVADPGVQVVALENAGGTPTDAQRTLREGWLASRIK
jgi:predicted metalloprotease with PDZ domain